MPGGQGVGSSNLLAPTEKPAEVSAGFAFPWVRHRLDETGVVITGAACPEPEAGSVSPDAWLLVTPGSVTR